MVYDCSLCAYTTDCKSNMNRHMQRKIPCNNKKTCNDEDVASRFVNMTEDLKFECKFCHVRMGKFKRNRHVITCKGVPVNTCEFCRKTFANAQSKCNHRKTCKAVTNSNKSTTDPVVAAAAVETTTAGTVYNIYNFYEYQQVIMFGNEDVRYLRDKEAMDERYREAVKSFPSMLDLLYFNADHEENHTVRKRTKKSNIIEFRHGDSWVGEGTETAIPKLLAQMQQKIAEAFGDANLALSMNVPQKTNHMTECLHNRTDRGLTGEGNIVDPFNFPPIRTDQATWTRFVDAMLHRFYHENASWMTRMMFKGYKETIVRELKEVACGEEYNIENFTMYRDGLKLYEHFLSLYPE